VTTALLPRTLGEASGISPASAGQGADHPCQSRKDPKLRPRVFLVLAAIDYSLDPVALFSVFSFAVKPVDAQASLENASYD